MILMGCFAYQGHKDEHAEQEVNNGITPISMSFQANSLQHIDTFRLGSGSWVPLIRPSPDFGIRSLPWQMR